MAANDYYNTNYNSASQQHDTAYHGSGALGGSQQEYGRTNGPLPPVPATASPSPYKVDTSYQAQQVASPFDDSQYPAYPRPAQQDNTSSGRQSPHYYGKPGNSSPGYNSNYNNDPFNDNNAIPLQNQGQDGHNKYGGGYAGAPSPTAGAGYAEHYGGQPPDGGRRPHKKQGWFKGKITWACYVLFLIQVAVFIAELVRNGQLQGTPIATKPSFNPMIGPSPYVLINMGARYPPCMKDVNVKIKGSNEEGPLASSLQIQCPNTTSNAAECPLSTLCGFGMDLTSSGGTPAEPNQWWRFITPIFLHGGLIHIAFNMLLQLTLGRDIEIQIGTIRFLLIYFSAGIFANIFAGNFAPNGLPSTGASGALFAVIALILLDLLYTWKNRKSPGKDLIFILLDIVIAFVIGLLPGLDNFAHIGGFLVGLMLGISLLRSPDTLRERIGLDDAKYATVPGITREDDISGGKGGIEGLKGFAKQPVGFFKGRKPLWWGWWLLRAGALALFIIIFAVLLNNFYANQQSCSWCKYLSCLVSRSLRREVPREVTYANAIVQPVKDWCDVGNLEYETRPAKRAMTMIENVFKS
jgi:membrane associated rhomboid family serine protease